MQIRTLLVMIPTLLIGTVGLQAQGDYNPPSKMNEGKDGRYVYRTVPDDPLQARYYRLDNGLTVILSVNKDAPRIQTMIAVKAGSNMDPATNTGLAHYLEHMLFKGTDRYGTNNWEAEKKEIDRIEGLYDTYNQTTDPVKRATIYHQIDSISGVAAKYAIPNEYDKMVGSIGASGTNAFTSFEQTVYINDIPSNQLEKWLMIESERFRSPVFRLFHTELEAVYEEKNISLDDDNDRANEVLMADLFRNHPYGTQTTIGTVEHLKNPSLREIRKFYNTYYVPNNMAMILVGDLDPAETIELIDRYFKSFQSQAVPPLLFQKEVERAAPRELTVTGPEAENVQIAWRLPGAGTHEALMVEMADLLLAYKGAGLIDLDLVKSQKVQSAGCSPMINKDYGVHFFYGEPREDQSLEDVRDLLLGEVAKLKRGEFNEEQMHAVVRNLEVDQMRSYQNNWSRGFALLGSFVTGVDPVQEANRFSMLRKITKQELVDFVNRFYNNDYTVLYKRQGDPEEGEKVDKPTITPIVLNREVQSPFVTSLLATPAPALKPVYIDYQKDIVRTKTKKGIEILSVPNNENDLFELYYVFDMGSDNDRLLPYAVDYLEYLGTDRYSAEELSRKFFDLGCSFNVSTERDQVWVSLTGPDESFNEGVALFEELLAHAKPDEEALEAMIGGIEVDRENAKTNKSTILFQGLLEWARYGEKNPFNDVLSNDELEDIEADDLVKMIHNLTGYQHRILYYGPQAAPAIAGKIDTYHATPATLKAYPPARIYPRQETDKNVVYFTDFDMVQAEIIWVRKDELYNPTNLPVRALYNEYFGGGMSSVVFQEIRESKALAYSTFATYDTPGRPDRPHYILSYVGTQADKMKQAIGAMDQLHETLPQSEQSFTSAKEALRNKLETQRVTRSAILFNYLNAEKMKQTVDSRRTLYDKLSSVTLNDLVSFHDARYRNVPYVLCVVGSEEKVDMDALKAHGEVKEIDLDKLFGY